MAPSFSRRTAWNRQESSWSRLVDRTRAEGGPVYDLTVSNPTRCGFEYGPNLLAGVLDQSTPSYDPDPRGIPSARSAIATYYADHGSVVPPEQVMLSTSTSEAYFYLLRLLCNPGDEVLAAQPSYPLFDYLADLSDVHVRAYPLFYDFGWWIDFAELERRITPRTRAILLVHPNNPTGHATPPSERERLEQICRQHGLALVVDEVFLDYGLGQPIGSFAAGDHPVLTFVVSGLSKVAALPQMKVAWLVALGPEQEIREALGRLEVVADTFLSLNTPMQLALPDWLASRHAIQGQILARVKANLACLKEHEISTLQVDGGWSALLRLPSVRPLERCAEELLEQEQVVVYPGHFFAIAQPNRIVVSLLTPLAEFAEGVRRLGRFCRSET